ncbi:MAG: TadE/TadG family type IV pilus assembly protein, partial [Lachnospiraceae bacterium]
MIEKFCKRDRGSVSVFLAIILVPMLTIAALFVDASKIKMAKGVAASATDLALNTALTDYDTMLKDMYGLFATAQDTDELYTRLEDYYRTCITSAGINDVDAQNVVEQLMAQLGAVEQSGNISDLLNMELIDFTASKVSGGNLANAAIMKNQIVEFMKYRSPVNTGLSFISSINAFKTLSKQTELVEDRTKYYEEEKNVLDTLKNAWIHIEKYNQTEIGTNGETYLNRMLETVKVWEGEYRKYHNYTIKDLVAPLDSDDSLESYFSYPWFAEKYYDPNGENIYGDKVEYPNDLDSDGNTIEDLWKFFNFDISAAKYHTYVDFMSDNKGILDADGNPKTRYDKETRPTKEAIDKLIESFNVYYNRTQSNFATLKAYISDNKAGENDFQYLAQALRYHEIGGYGSTVFNMYTIYQSLKYTILWAEEDTYVKDDWLKLQIKYVNEMQNFVDITKHLREIANSEAYKNQINNELKATNDGLKNIKN